MSAGTPIELYDTTLRDGAGSEGISFSKEDKLSVLRILRSYGVTFVEGGIPNSNPKDAAFFREAAASGLSDKLVAFSSTAHKNTVASEDGALNSLASAGTRYVCIFGKASASQAAEILQIDGEQNLKIIKESISFLRAAGKDVVFDAEHFFDGYAENAEYALAVLKAAQTAGASRLVLCDTNGGSLPENVATAVAAVVEKFGDDCIVGIHCHNDNGLATANTLAAIGAGATHVQGTFIGLGERCGNANLSTIIGNFAATDKSRLSVRYEDTTRTARAIAEICNVSLPKNMPYVGKSAFAHKAGMHADAILKSPKSFEHIAPETVGNRRRFLVSEIAGRAAVAEKLASTQGKLEKTSGETAAILEKIKEMENLGYQYEGAEASFVLLSEKVVGNYTPAFKLVSATTSTVLGGEASASVSVEVGGEIHSAEARGNGPVNALDAALRKALVPCLPEVAMVYLKDYKVRVINPEQATAALVRVLITSSDGSNNWTTIGVSTDVIEASRIALSDSIDYLICKRNMA